MTDTLERREAIIKLRRVRDNLTPGAIERADLDGMAFDIDAAILALSLPAREVSGERAREIAVGKEPCPCGHPRCRKFFLTGIGSFVQGSGFTEEEADRIIAALATTPAPREKLEADLVEAKKALDAAIECELALIGHLEEATGPRPGLAAYYKGFAERHLATLNRLSGEG